MMISRSVEEAVDAHQTPNVSVSDSFKNVAAANIEDLQIHDTEG